MLGIAALIGLMLTGVVGVRTVAAEAEPVPPAGYAIRETETRTSPDGSISIEQYLNKEADDWKWQFRLRRQGAAALLDPEPAGYPAEFVFSGDAKWIVRIQKIGSGTSTLHLYGLSPSGPLRVSAVPLGERAWHYLKTHPDWRKRVKAPKYHISASLLRPRQDDDRASGADGDRYLLIALSGDADVEGRKPMQTRVVNGWRCRYDTRTGRFDVPAGFSAANAKALAPE